MMLDLWHDQKAVIYTGLLLLIFVIVFLIIPIWSRPAGLKIDAIPGNKDLIVMATEAPDIIQVYRPGTAGEPKIRPSDERMNDMKVDKAGQRVFVATKEGWLNIFNPHKLTADKTRHKLGDILQGVALSGDEKFIAVGLGSSEDYNARDVAIYSLKTLLESDKYYAPPTARFAIAGDIQTIVANPDPSNNRGYVLSSQDDKIIVFDFRSGERVGFIEVGNSMGKFRCTPDGSKAYGSVNARNTVIVMDLAPGRERLIKSIKVPSSPFALAFNAEGSRLYVGSRDDSEIYIIDTATDEIIDTLLFMNAFGATRLSPETLGVSTDEKYIYMIPQYEVLFIYEIDPESPVMDVVQTHKFPKKPDIMEVIRPK
jgi:DNA-binding beta-propeller fold protein YncE